MENELIRKRMHEILDIYFDCNGIEKRSRDRTGTLPTMFLRINGHVNSIDIDLFTDGWLSGVSADKRWDYYLDKITDESIADIRAAVKAALTDKKETDVLLRDILRQEGKVKDEKDKLALMKKTLRRKERKEKAAVGAATHS